MSFWTDWSDGKKWSMGILGAVLVAVLGAAINHLFQSPQNTAPAQGPAKMESSERGPKLSSKQLLGDWNLEYVLLDDRPAWKTKARFAENDVLGIDPTIVQAFGPRGRWVIDEAGFVTLYLQTRIRADTATLGSANDLLRDVTCRLQADETGSLLQGRCVDGRGTTSLRLNR